MLPDLSNVIINAGGKYVCREKVFDYIESSSQNGAMNNKVVYSLYLAMYVTGSSNKKILIKAPPEYVIHEGERNLCLVPILNKLDIPIPSSSPSYDPESFKNMLMKRMDIPKFAMFGEKKVEISVVGMWESLFSPHSCKMYLVVPPCIKEELKKIKDINEVVKYALHNGVTQDERLVHLMMAQIPKPDVYHTLPKEYAPIAPHGVIITNTKTGKSTLARHVSSPEHVVNRPTESNLLGWSTSDTIHKGILDGLSEALFIDEYTEVMEENLSKGLFTFMEQGETTSARGRTNHVSGFASLVFMGNPAECASQSLEELTESLRSNLIKVTNNFRAWSSRIGVFMFTNTAKRGTGFCQDSMLAIRCSQVLQSLREIYAPQFSRLIANITVLEWLNRPFDAWYVDALNDIYDQCMIPEIKEFIIGQKDAFRHVHGAALHIAFAESYQELVDTNAIEVNKLLLRADEIFNEMLGENINSFRLILQVKMTKETVDNIKSASPFYIQTLISSLLRLDFSNHILFDTLIDKFIPSEKYCDFQTFKTAVTSAPKRTMYLSKFGLTMGKDNLGNWQVIVTHPEIWNVYKAKPEIIKGSGSYKCTNCQQIRLGVGPICPACSMEVKK